MKDELKTQLHNAMDELHFSDEAKYRMIIQLCLNGNGQEREKAVMKKFGWKAAAIAAAAAIMCIGGTAYAAGHISYYVSHSSALGDYHSFSDLEKAEKKAGYDVSVIENFRNGYEFSEISIHHTSAMDEDDNKLHEWEEIGLQYKRGDNLVFLDTEPFEMYSVASEAGEERTATDRVTVGDTEVRYNRDEYLFLPPKYEEEALREEFAEDFARQETDDHFFISYGSDEVERKVFQSVRFEKGDVSYLLSNMDGSVSKDDLYEMAAELIAAK